MQPVRARGVALPIDLRDELREAYYAEPAEDDLRAQLAEAREVLRSAQWSSVVWSGETAWMACPSCERIDPSRTRGMPESLRPLVGHAPDCRLANVLGEGV